MTPEQDAVDRRANPVARWGQERRLEFIDFRLAWDGRLNRANLMDFFGISVPQASMDISRYRDLAPNNLAYDGSARMYVATQNFTPLYAGSSPTSFLSELLAEESGVIGTNERLMGWRPPVARMPVPARNLDPKVLFSLLRAIRENAALEVLYQSIQRPEPSLRVLSPHALGHDGFRWHIRAFCHTRQDYRDFVMARILKVERNAEPWVSGEEDIAWHTVLKLVLAPNPRLSKASQRVIELDYGMTDGEVGLTCRHALAFYALRHLGLGEKLKAQTEAQQVILRNRREVRKYLQDADPTASIG
jgi:WYL domain